MIHKLFTLPLKWLVALGEKIDEEVGQELYNLPKIQQELLQLNLAFERGEMSEDVFEMREEELLKRYQIAKEREMGNLEGDV